MVVIVMPTAAAASTAVVVQPTTPSGGGSLHPSPLRSFETSRDDCSGAGTEPSTAAATALRVGSSEAWVAMRS
jgi:hypothetical protein